MFPDIGIQHFEKSPANGSFAHGAGNVALHQYLNRLAVAADRSPIVIHPCRTA